MFVYDQHETVEILKYTIYVHYSYTVSEPLGPLQPAPYTVGILSYVNLNNLI